MKIERGLLAPQAAAAAAALTNSVMTIFAGDEPLVRCSPKTVTVTGAQVSAAKWAAQPIKSGAPTRFEIVGADKALLVSGSVGNPEGGKSVDLVYTPELIVKGLTFELPVFDYEVS